MDNIHDVINSDFMCEKSSHFRNNVKEQLSNITEAIIDHNKTSECFTHLDSEPISSEASIVNIIDAFRDIIFPGYYKRKTLDSVNLRYSVGQTVSNLFDLVSKQVTHNIKHECLRYKNECVQCNRNGNIIALKLVKTIPAIRRILFKDVMAAYDTDPSAKSYDEIIFSYPGIYAITVYRLAHKLFKLEVPLLPRMISEYAHTVTGIDIHPGATIGEGFFIDHGTGIVIGETTEIGNNVRIYQGVTLGAVSLPVNSGKDYRGKKRHPKIENDVTIYSGATILGGETIIGARSIIGGNVWITKSVPKDTTVMTEPPKLLYKNGTTNL